MAKPDVEDIYPLTPLQEGMLFHSLYSPTGGDYVRQLCFRLGKDVDLGLLEQSWTMVVNRHPALRSSVEWRELDRPLQLVHRRVTIPVEHRAWQEGERAALAHWRDEVLAEERRRGLDLGSPPLMRLTFLFGPERQRELVWTFHHLLFDGWCRPLILGELRTCYRALALGEAPILSERRPYRDYIAWLTRRDASADEAWWRGVLDGVTTPTRLRHDGHGAESPEEGVNSETLLLSAEATERLKHLARESRVTPSTLIIGAWGVLLSRESGRSDVMFGLTVSGRPAELAGVESMVGLFINTVPVRMRVPSEEVVSAWLQRLQAEQVDLRQHEHTPLADIQAWSELPPKVPLFDTLLVFGFALDEGSADEPGEIFEVYRSVEQTNYPLMLTILIASRIELTLVYDRQQFTRETVLRLRDHLDQLMHGMVARPDSRLGELDMRTADEIDVSAVEMKTVDANLAHDPQVESNGERDALRKVQLALAAHPGVADALVARAEGDSRGHPVLAAYVVPSIDPGPEPAELRAHLATRVPPDMMPSVFVKVDAIPASPSGNADLDALPEPEPQTLNTEMRFVAPRSNVEERMAAIWARTLRLERVSVYDDFFELGGHSLLVVRLVGEMQREFGVAIPLLSFYEGEATVAGLSAVVENMTDSPAASGPMLSMHTRTASPVNFFVYPNESSMLTLRHFTRALGPAQRVVGLLPERKGARFDQSRSIEDLATAILRTIRETQPSGPYHITGFSMGGLLAYEIASQLRALGEEVAWLALIDRGPAMFSHRAMQRRLSLRRRFARQRERGFRGALRHTGKVVCREAIAALVRLHLRPSRLHDDFDWRGALKLVYRYSCPGNDAPMDLFPGAGSITESGSSSLGWDQVHLGPLRVHHAPGDHKTMLQEPYVSLLAEEVAKGLHGAHERAKAMTG